MDNILVCHEIVRGFERKNHSPATILKIDLRKAYDSISWQCIEETMHNMRFPQLFIDWVMECISSPRFSILMNGSLVGFFPSNRGLRQGDPISPYFFCLAMENLTTLVEEEVDAGRIELIAKCKGVKLSHLAYTDDQLDDICQSKYPVSRSSQWNTWKILKYYNLQVNRDKSTQMFARISMDVQQRLIGINDFTLGHLQVKYLGLPLIQGKLSYQECAPIIDKI